MNFRRAIPAFYSAVTAASSASACSVQRGCAGRSSDIHPRAVHAGALRTEHVERVVANVEAFRRRDAERFARHRKNARVGLFDAGLLRNRDRRKIRQEFRFLQRAADPRAVVADDAETVLAAERRKQRMHTGRRAPLRAAGQRHFDRAVNFRALLRRGGAVHRADIPKELRVVHPRPRLKLVQNLPRGPKLGLPHGFPRCGFRKERLPVQPQRRKPLHGGHLRAEQRIFNVKKDRFCHLWFLLCLLRLSPQLQHDLFPLAGRLKQLRRAHRLRIYPVDRLFIPEKNPLMHNVCLPCHRIHACASTGNIRPRRSKSRKPAPRTNSVVSSSCTASFFLHYSGKRTACKEKTAGVSAGETSAVSHEFKRSKKAFIRLTPGHGAAKNPVISAFPKGAASPAPDNARSTRAPCGRSSAFRYDPLQNVRILKQHVAAAVIIAVNPRALKYASGGISACRTSSISASVQPAAAEDSAEPAPLSAAFPSAAQAVNRSVMPAASAAAKILFPKTAILKTPF